jgi:beta-galactosidase beta subunit
VNFNPQLKDLVEIFDGNSRFDLNGQTLFFRHFSLRDQSSIGEFYEKHRKRAISRGIESEEEVRSRVKRDNDWSDEEDLKIAELESYVNNLETTKKHIILPSQKEAHQKLIDDERMKLAKLMLERDEIFGRTAEEYASKKANEEFLRLLIYNDPECRDITYNQDKFDDLSVDILTQINNAYYVINQRFIDDCIQKLVLQDCFNMYLSSCENPYHFFGKYIYQLSAYQMKLLIYGRIFNNIFQYHEDLPDYLRKDPKGIFEFVEAKKAREGFEASGDDSATVLFGATQKDLEVLDPTAKKISLSDALSKNGGTLNMEQMMALMNN